MENVKREELEKLVGIDKVNTFYNIVNEITKLYDMEQDFMIWNKYGIMVEKNGLMNISLEKVEKLYVLFILKIIHWDL